MKNVTISLPEELWSRLRDEAAEKRISLNAYVREILSSESGPEETMGERLARRAEEMGPAPKSWKWNREEIYEELI